MTVQVGIALRRSALALACILIFPAAALADSKREAALEQRVSDLERQLQELMAEVKAQRNAPLQIVQAPPPPPPAEKALPAGAKPIQETTLVPAAAFGNTTVKVGGFVKLDAMATRTDGGTIADNSAGRMFYVPGGIPVGGRASSTLIDESAQLSRLGIGIDSKTDAGDKLGAFFEWDFYGGGNAATQLGNPIATNTYGLTLRHAYVYWNEWLAGQTWSNFMDANAMPEAVDFIGVTDGTVFVRQPQIRYTNGGWSFAVENPDTTVIPNGGGAIASIKRNTVPDLTGRYTWKGDWGFIGVAGMVRQLRNESDTLGRDAATGGALSVMGRYNLSKSDDLRFALTGGNAVGRYIGLGSIGADAELDALGEIKTRNVVAGYLSWRHAFDAQWRTNVMVSANRFDNDVAFTGGAATKNTESVHANVIYSPLPKLDVGAELSYGKREVENGDDGDLTRLQVMVKYSF